MGEGRYSQRLKRREGAAVDVLDSGPLSPLSLEEVNDGLLESRLVGRRVMVAFAFGSACGWDCREEASDLLVGGIGPPVEDENRYIDCPEGLGRETFEKTTANDCGDHFRVGSRNSNGNQIR